MLEKKVCKHCGKSGYFLKLDNNLLCRACADLLEKGTDMNEIADELAEFATGEGSLKRIEALIKAQNEANERGKINFESIYREYERARKIEKEGDTEKALACYLKILKKCPPGTDYYVRPCIILERKHDYAYAIEICDLAIKNIREGRFKADEEEFQHRKSRLLKKLEKVTNEK